MLRIYKNLVGTGENWATCVERNVTNNIVIKCREKKNIIDLVNAITEMF